jgi:hypothetical protein
MFSKLLKQRNSKWQSQTSDQGSLAPGLELYNIA